MRLPYSLSEDCVLLFSPWYVLGGGEGESDSLNNSKDFSQFITYLH